MNKNIYFSLLLLIFCKNSTAMEKTIKKPQQKYGLFIKLKNPSIINLNFSTIKNDVKNDRCIGKYTTIDIPTIDIVEKIEKKMKTNKDKIENFLTLKIELLSVPSLFSPFSDVCDQIKNENEENFTLRTKTEIIKYCYSLFEIKNEILTLNNEYEYEKIIKEMRKNKIIATLKDAEENI